MVKISLIIHRAQIGQKYDISKKIYSKNGATCTIDFMKNGFSMKFSNR